MTEPFKPKYLDRQREKRDRFEAELNKEERAMLLDAAIRLRQHKDGALMKQLAFLGYYAISRPESFIRYYRDTLLKNERNNKRNGVVVETELENKARAFREKTGRELYPRGVPSE